MILGDVATTVGQVAFFFIKKHIRGLMNVMSIKATVVLSTLLLCLLISAVNPVLAQELGKDNRGPRRVEGNCVVPDFDVAANRIGISKNKNQCQFKNRWIDNW